MNRVYKKLLNSKINKDRINEILSFSESFYQVYYLPKKNKKGSRKICKPDEELAALQYAVLPLIKKLPTDRASVAYEQGCSTRKNAFKHRKRPHILHADIKDFFGSIDQRIFFNALKRRFNSEELDTLWKLCSYKGGLPIGAPTSPFLSNRIMKHIDLKMKRISPFIRYTRYADDMVLSSRKYLDRMLINKVSAILDEYGFRLNDAKTYFMTARREVTGIILTDANRLSTGTGFKKELKKDIYNLLVKNNGKVDAVRGKLAYLNSIEPAYAKAVKRKYVQYDNVALFKIIKN